MKLTTYLLAPVCAATIAACSGSSDDSVATTAPTAAPSANLGANIGASPTIDQVAGRNGFNALLAAAAKAEMGAALSNSNANLTVFAPTDTAFNQLATSLGFADAAAMVEALPPATLKSILSYHVLPAIKRSADLEAATQPAQPTLYEFEGQSASLTLGRSQSGATITDAALTAANITSAEVVGSNGVIYAIDKVLVPPGVLNIVQMAQINPQLSSLVSAVVSANLQGTLSGPGPFTVFAPTNAAFSAAPGGLSSQQLATVLTYHVLGTQVLSSQIPFGTAINTLSAQTFVINAGDPPTISDTSGTPARILATDVRASNGVIHVISKVLIPAL